MAANAFRLLHTWSTTPGTREDGVLDGVELRQWIVDARRLLEEADRLSIGEEYIGKVLAASPPDPDGTWPGVEVRNLLEDLQNPQIEEGMVMAILNGRGFTSHSPDEGGRQEWELVEENRRKVDQFADEWPRAASVFRTVADNYEAMARREDSRAERFRRGLDR